MYTAVKDDKSKGIVYIELNQNVLDHHKQYGEKIHDLGRVTEDGDELTDQEMLKEVTKTKEQELEEIIQQQSEIINQLIVDSLRG